MRTGQPGGQYPNRSDLRNPGNEQVKGQPYGERAAQQAAQRAVPITGPPQAPVPPTGPAGGATGTAPLVPSAPATAGAGGPAPGELTPLFAPTERPGEPVTAGIGLGPGPGREALNATPLGRVTNNMAQGDTATALLASLASRPDASATLQDLARLAVNGPIR
jgi:hypothetical protein